MMVYIYKLVDLKGRDRYVGITSDVKARARRHKLKMKEHLFVVLEQHTDRQQAGLREVALIEELKTHCSNGGWNRTFGGEHANISGVSRKGVGGRKKGSVGNVGWNPSPATRQLWSEQRKGLPTKVKMDASVVAEMIKLYRSRPELVTGISKNGRMLPYDRAFCKKHASRFGMTEANAYRIIKGRALAWNHLL